MARHPFEQSSPQASRRGSRRAEKRLYRLSKKIIRWNKAGDYYRIRDAVEGLGLVAGIGAGKSSILRHVAQAYFEYGMGGLCLGPKESFAGFMADLLSTAGALDRTLFVREREDGTVENGINLIQAECEIFGSGGKGLAENIAQTLFAVAEVITRNLASSSDPFWQAAARQMLTCLIVLDMEVHGSIDVRRIRRMMNTLPRPHHLDDDWDKRECLAVAAQAKEKVEREREEAEAWVVVDSADDAAPNKKQGESTLSNAIDYVTRMVPEMPDKTLQSIIASLDVVLAVFCTDVVYNACCKDCGSWKVSDIRELGTVIVCDFPVRRYGPLGFVIGAFLKRVIGKQLESEVKNYPSERLDEMRPVAWIIDDCGSYMESSDVLLFSTSREARLCPVLCIQNLGLLREALGGTDQALNRAKTLMSFMLTVLGGQNDDQDTCGFYAGKRGQRLELRIGGGKTEPEQGRGRRGSRVTENRNYNFQPAPELAAHAYLGLLRGGLENFGEITAILTTQYKLKGTKRRWLKLRIFQKPPCWTEPPASTLEFYQRWRWRWNDLKKLNCCIWFDSSPRLRIWTGHVAWWKVAGWLFLSPPRGKMLFSQWAHFWLTDDREIAVYTENEYRAKYAKR